MGNWEQHSSADEVVVWGRHAVIGRNGAILEVSIDGVNWETIHTFPATEGELYEFDVPSETHVRVTGGGQWAVGKFNDMSG